MSRPVANIVKATRVKSPIKSLFRIDTSKRRIKDYNKPAVRLGKKEFFPEQGLYCLKVAKEKQKRSVEQGVGRGLRPLHRPLGKQFLRF
jgi:hypothetical protein